MKTEHINSAYEYATRSYENRRSAPYTLNVEHQAMRKSGWENVWSDVSIEGVFAVYRRARGPGRRTKNGEVASCP
jgi:hypothetical protein